MPGLRSGEPSRSSHGAGPGVITPDGCAVDFYAMLPASSDGALINEAIAPAASILELGCGTGRDTRVFAAAGHRVVAVDESQDMLDRVAVDDLIRTVCAPIEGLQLGERFDVVVLPSFLANEPDDDLVAGFVGTCAAHVRPAGCVLIRRHALDWFDTAAPFETAHPDIGVTYRMRDVSRPDPDLLAATMEYDAGDRLWTQVFVARRLDDVRLASMLAAAGLRPAGFLTDDGGWVRAVPVHPAESPVDG